GDIYRTINSLGGIEGASLNVFDDVEVELRSRRTASSLEHCQAEPEQGKSSRYIQYLDR
ncbi:hypothetical protein BDQ12DRAFT_689825, partial [Crucibulum laeve]